MITQIGARPDQCYFWATHSGAELDLLVVAQGRRRGFEIKRTVSPHVTPSIATNIRALSFERLGDIV